MYNIREDSVPQTQFDVVKFTLLKSKLGDFWKNSNENKYYIDWLSD